MPSQITCPRSLPDMRQCAVVFFILWPAIYCSSVYFFLSFIFSYDIVQEVELLVAQTSGSVYVRIVYISYCCIALMQNNLDWNLFSLLHEFFVFVLYVFLRRFFLQNVFGIWNDFFASSTLQSYKPKNRHLLPCHRRNQCLWHSFICMLVKF